MFGIRKVKVIKSLHDGPLASSRTIQEMIYMRVFAGDNEFSMGACYGSQNKKTCPA